MSNVELNNLMERRRGLRARLHITAFFRKQFTS